MYYSNRSQRTDAKQAPPTHRRPGVPLPALGWAWAAPAFVPGTMPGPGCTGSRVGASTALQKNQRSFPDRQPTDTTTVCEVFYAQFTAPPS